MQDTNTTKNNRRRRLIIGAIVLLVAAAAVFFIFQRISNQASAQVGTGDVVAAFVGDLDAAATAGGRIEAQSVVRLAVASPGTVQEILVNEGDHVGQGAPLLRLESRSLALQVARAEQNVALKEANLEALQAGPDAAELSAAQASVNSAQAQLDDLVHGPSTQEIAESQANIDQAQASVNSAAASLGSTRDSISQSSLASAQAELINAQIAYEQAKERNEDFAFSFTHEALVAAEQDLAIAQAKVDELSSGADQGSLNAAAADISSANANLEQARQNHEQLLAGPTDDQIAAAEAALAQARLNLDNLEQSTDEQDLLIAQAELQQARLDLANAQETLAKTTLNAPFDGLVTAVLVAPGERAGGEVIELVSDQLKVVLNVDEIDVGALSAGQDAVITLETWPDQEIPARIVSIAPKAAGSGDGIVTYDVQINLEETPNLPILVGMTANARLITARRGSVVLVPNAAITADRQAGTFFVNKITSRTEEGPLTEEVQVTVGLRDDNYTQIISGLQAGDEVLIGELAPPVQQFGPFGGG